MAKQVGIKPYSQSDTIHMILKMEYLYPLMPKPNAYYLFYRSPMNFRIGVVLSMLGAHITKQ